MPPGVDHNRNPMSFTLPYCGQVPKQITLGQKPLEREDAGLPHYRKVDVLVAS
jgi:hypothetical protein